jgi:uncharacterized integral membrane protein
VVHPDGAPAAEGNVDQLIEVWKQTVGVQQHFNDLCWRIRGLALTALTFALGAAAIAAKDPVEVDLFGWHLQLAAIVTFLGLVLWRAFYFVDRRWYHQLLIGSVTYGAALEARMIEAVPDLGWQRVDEDANDVGVPVGLGGAISVASQAVAVNLLVRRPTMKSTDRLRLFYEVISGLLVLVVVVFAAASPDTKASGVKPTLSPTSTLTPTPPAAKTTGPHL